MGTQLADELLTLKDAHKELNGKLSLSSLYLAVETRALPHYRVSGGGGRGRILIRRSDLLAWLEGQKVTPAASLPGRRRHLLP